MSGGAGSPVNPSSNASSPYEYDLLLRRSPRVGSASRGRDVAPTYTPEHISLADRTRRPYAVGPKECERRCREFEAATKAKRLVEAAELVEEERRTAKRGRRLSRGDPPIKPFLCSCMCQLAR
ncbi:hypothetical protein D6D10_06548 [Aureobasidium pullulans]|uniref:Uncharacterized protein n=1 Tax=Aureobasidium pullulans TaxID=5580 RepID=A0A4S9ES52_AURPU|nr:hypothetical protein D6D10_06548 [Aureobasidium pullulans]